MGPEEGKNTCAAVRSREKVRCPRAGTHAHMPSIRPFSATKLNYCYCVDAEQSRYSGLCSHSDFIRRPNEEVAQGKKDGKFR